jgi:hypothetical protein
MKHDASRLSAQPPESLRGARPPGPVRFSPHDAPARERPDLHRASFGRAVIGVPSSRQPSRQLDAG